MDAAPQRRSSTPPHPARKDFLVILLALTAPGSADAASVTTGDVIYACDFDHRAQEAAEGAAGTRGADLDYDGWPDGWSRLRSLKLPEFVRVGIVAEGQTIALATAQPAAETVNRVLRMELDGGGATVQSQPVAISPEYSLHLSLRIKTTALAHDGAWATLLLLDADNKILQSVSSRPVSETGDWLRVEIGPITPDSRKVVQAAISLHVGPLGTEQDLTGSAEFDDVQLVRLPRMTLQANSPTGLYVYPATPVFTCDVSGIRIAQPEVRFDLLDYEGQILATQTVPLIPSQSRPVFEATPAPAIEGFTGQATFKPAVPGFGHYRVTASLVSKGDSRGVLGASRSLAVLRPLPPPHLTPCASDSTSPAG
ncbi:MAG TPA: hypothetical protein VFV87_00985 [Pirellulaceae bacterium]|nr:hypothetical protein [Pirellulaceae bacterium]